MTRTFLLSLALLALACTSKPHSHDDGDDHDHAAETSGHGAHGGESAHGHGHGHGHAEDAEAFTTWTDNSELFVEIPPLIVGQPAELAVHVTRLPDFGAVTHGRLTVTIGAQEFVFEAPSVPGIFRATLRPERAEADAKMTFTVAPRPVEGGGVTLGATHQVTGLKVFATAAAAAKSKASQEEEHDDGAIPFLKEQQWRVPFGVEEVVEREVRPAFEAWGTLRPMPGGEATVLAPISGRLGVHMPGFIVGRSVRRGERLGTLLRAPSVGADVLSLQRAKGSAGIALRKARADVERLEPLVAAGTVPDKQLIAARFQRDEARLRATEAAARLEQQGRSVGLGEKASSLTLRAPIAGVVDHVGVAPGTWVQRGAALARIVAISRLQIEVQIPEAHVSALPDARRVRFRVEGFESSFASEEGSVPRLGASLDPHTRTLPLYAPVDNRDLRLRSGMFATAFVENGPARPATVVPRQALLTLEGVPHVVVQLGGESFERRVVRLGLVDGDVVEVLEGLKPGARVVTRGAYTVHLAGTAATAPAHGHAH